ncbi:MAG: tRNA-dihydrouridine synthase [Cellvibrio sp.]|nr:tRNA-dihydrouridine synthase [Cellvibrio sp.]
MRIMLAPMEGVVEHHVRAILSKIGGLDGCVTEFIRVTDQKLPYKVFYKYAQELESDCKTPSGIPVKVQLLGSNPHFMALNAQELVRYGAKSIDLNFGCPAKTVNAHEGGAYKPPAYWHYIADIRAKLTINVVANGEIWSVADYFRCREESQCDDVMLGRGLIAQPDLAKQIRCALNQEPYTPLSWLEICQMLFDYYRSTTPLYYEKNCGNRVKQWLMYLSRNYPEAASFFEFIKRKSLHHEIEQAFQEQLDFLLNKKHSI